MGKSRGVRIVELLVLVSALGIATLLLRCALDHQRREARRVRCWSNLGILAKGMAAYLGDNRFYPWPAGRPGCGTVASPDFGGAEWLAALYWSGLMPDIGVFWCPSTSDGEPFRNPFGPNGCPGGKRLEPHAVSYAAMGDSSVGIYRALKLGKSASYAASKLAVQDDFPPHEPMACDDTQEPINHGTADNGGMNVLFFDAHVEWWTHERVDLERGVGMAGTELVHLRN